MVVKIILGQEVKDKVTGYQGIAVSVTEFLQGCRRVSIQPPMDKEKKIPDELSFDEPQLDVISRGILPEEKVEKQPRKTGGPHFGVNTQRPQIVK